MGVPVLTFILGISLELPLQYTQHHQQRVCAQAAHTLAEQGQGSAEQLASDRDLTGCIGPAYRSLLGCSHHRPVSSGWQLPGSSWKVA